MSAATGPDPLPRPVPPVVAAAAVAPVPAAAPAAAPSPLPVASPLRRDAWPWVAAFVAVPVLGALGIGVAALLAPEDVTTVTVVVAALVVVGALTVALGAAHRARRAAEHAVEDLLAALDAARGESVRDEATGLLNRRGVLLIGTQVLESARRSGGAVHACLVEVVPGARLGNALSEEELALEQRQEWAATATALKAATRSADVVAHDDGNRFVVLGPGSGLHAQELERRVRVGLAQGRLEAGGDRSRRLAVEVGAAVLAPWDEGDVADLLVRAEQSLTQRRALRRSAPQHGWGRRRNDERNAPGRTDRTGT
ncbi:GGDEF domain-containing protein [Kineococcus rubinsiae]|uniref:GGDEF domain-containing protein n=1 Tax=Kineococcus rubinsiae TaxID=2609562 RepID=UPI001431A1D4|nr:GGDEF domain-containing protein [Kineococcus rubinsiae]NIZ93118.1 GGDEF domain-containing protein [Kineococcus rubinsiae]